MAWIMDPIIEQILDEKSQLKWDKRFLKLAKEVSTWSKDPSTQVGCVVVDEDRRIVSLGYNGFPKGVEDSDERLNNRELKYKIVLHSEDNAIITAERERLVGSTFYTYPFEPCSNCGSKIIQVKAKRVVTPKTKDVRLKQSWSNELTRELFAEAGVILDFVEIEDE